MSGGGDRLWEEFGGCKESLLVESSRDEVRGKGGVSSKGSNAQ